MRWRRVPIVTDEQRVLLAFAHRHAQGKNGKMFGPLANIRAQLAAATKKLGAPRISPHLLRKAAGQWLIDLGAPLELVSRVLGHADTRITETIYARVRDDDVAARLLESVDARYTQTARRERPERVVDTITQLPEPKILAKTYTVDGVTRTLAEWVAATGIAKGTLFHRVEKVGLSMRDAIKLGWRARPRLARPRGASADDSVVLGSIAATGAAHTGGGKRRDAV